MTTTHDIPAGMPGDCACQSSSLSDLPGASGLATPPAFSALGHTGEVAIEHADYDFHRSTREALERVLFERDQFTQGSLDWECKNRTAWTYHQMIHDVAPMDWTREPPAGFGMLEAAE